MVILKFRKLTSGNNSGVYISSFNEYFSKKIIRQITLCYKTNKMKKIIFSFLAVAFSLTAISHVTAEIRSIKPGINAADSAHVKTLMRLKEIKAIDRSTLSRARKKALRKETRAIKRSLRKVIPVQSNENIYAGKKNAHSYYLPAGYYHAATRH